MAKAQTGPTYRERDLVKHVDNFLKAAGMPMTTKQYYDWIYRESAQAKRDQKKRYSVSQFKRNTYKKIIELGKQEWLLSTNGVVKALHYDKNNKQLWQRCTTKKDPSQLRKR